MTLYTHKELKKYYSIHEVAAQFGVAETLLRFWEQEFPQLHPHKAGRNVRQDAKEDIETVRTIYTLVKVRGLKIAAARQLLSKNKDGEQNIAEAISKLKDVRQQLAKLNRSLVVLDPTLEGVEWDPPKPEADEEEA